MNCILQLLIYSTDSQFNKRKKINQQDNINFPLETFYFPLIG